MKRLFLTLLAAIALSGTTFAANIEVLPTMQSKTNIQDRVWVGTFQIVWNDFMDKIAFNQIKFPTGTPQIVNELNKQDFTVNELSEKCYYKYFGSVTKKTKRTIEKNIKKKFNETSDILGKLDLTPDKNKILIYAMLKKDFQFASPFDKLGKSKFRNSEAEFFGIAPNSPKELDEIVSVLFYNNSADYAVKLKTKGNDEVYLYKTSNTKPFNFIYADMLKKKSQYKDSNEFTEQDLLKVPNLKFFEEKEFDEIEGQRVKGSNLVIDKAIETIRFEMDNSGVKLKSEAAMSIMKTSLVPTRKPRYFYFDDTFVLFLKEKGKNKPYFALRVHDIANFQ